MYPKVIIIILNWNGREDTKECLDSLKKVSYPNFETYLIDNGSNDGSIEYFRQYPGISIIENEKNLGYAEGNNIGIIKALEKGADYILLLNNDTIVDPKFLDELVKIALNNQKLGILGPKIYCYDIPKKIFNYNQKFNLWTGNFNFSKNIINDIENENREVDYLSGCCMLISSKSIKEIGMFDHKYFLYWEDTDLCYRIGKYYKILYVPKAVIWHKVSSTSGNSSNFYYFRNLFMFSKKHAKITQIIFLLIFFLGVRFWIHSIIILSKKDVQSFLYFLRGTKEGIKILMGTKRLNS